MACTILWSDEPEIWRATFNAQDQRRKCFADIVRPPIENSVQCGQNHRQRDEVAALTEIIAASTRHEIVTVPGRVWHAVGTGSVVSMMLERHATLMGRIHV